MLRSALIAAAGLGLIAVVRLAARPLEQIRLPAAESVPSTPAVERVPRISADSGAGIAARNPFRITRRPALSAYDPLRLAEQQAPLPSRPVLLLVGVMDGPQASAVIEGFPGVEGARVVRVGDIVGGLSIKSAAGGRVVITGMDTTWVLQVREPWKN